MKKRPYLLYIDDILNSMNKIESYINGVEYYDFVNNNMLIDAVIRNLEIIGEASKNIPSRIKSQYPGIPWKRMTGLRNIIIHEYFGVDLNIIWIIITKNIPETKPLIMQMMNELKL